MLKLLIVADQNDADYLYSINTVTEKDLCLIQKVVDTIMLIEDEHNRYNWPTDNGLDSVINKYKGLLTKKEIYAFNAYVPYNEYGVHTITKVEVLNVSGTASMYEKL